LSRPTLAASGRTPAPEAGAGSAIGRFVPPLAVSVLVLLWAPFVADVRDALRGLLAAQFALVVGGLVVGVVLAALGVALARIRTARRSRTTALAASLALFGVWIWAFRTGRGEVDAVELVHFLQYGLIAALFYRAVRDLASPAGLVLTLLYGILVGTLDEWVQWRVPTRVGEARDVGLNLYAVGCGLLFGLGLFPPPAFHWQVPPPHRRAIRRFAGAVLLVFAGFFDRAHLGYEVHDPEIGRFRSYFTREHLLALQVRRAAEWRARPPRGLEPLAKEDYYLTEGGWHAQARNEAYAARAYDAAWRENRILEKYFEPFLELRSFASGQPHRWPPAQRAEVDARRGAVARTEYTSPAGFARIYTRPSRPVFWALVAPVAGALLIGGRGERRRAAHHESGEA
jgi:hypothetical protein